jgi:hypothetical protein
LPFPSISRGAGAAAFLAPAAAFGRPAGRLPFAAGRGAAVVRFFATRAAFFRAAGRLDFPVFFEAARLLPRLALLFAFFLATIPPRRRLLAARPDHTIGTLSKGEPPRIVVEPLAGGISIEIRPLARTRGARWRIGLLAAVVLVLALMGGARLARAWEVSLRRGAFEELPLAVLLPVTLAVGVSTPLALTGLAALAFAEERIDVTHDRVSIRSTAFEKTRVEIIPRRDLIAWVETYRPLPPWWTWAFRRLAARVGTRLVPVAGAAGHGEKRAIGLALSRATGIALIGVSGRPVTAGRPVKIPG